MSFTFFLTDIPPSVTEAAFGEIFARDAVISASYAQSAAGPVVMVEVRNPGAAVQLAAELECVGLDGTGLTAVGRETALGEQLTSLFAAIRRRQIHPVRQHIRSSGCLLVVDDDPDSLDEVHALVSAGLPHACVHAASSGDAALRLNQIREFAAILSDVQMCGLSGLSLVQAIRQIRPHTPVVLMTGRPDLLSLLIDSGAFGFMRKPLDRTHGCKVLAHAGRFHALSKAMVHAPDDVVDSDRAELVRLALFEREESERQWHRAR